MVNGQRVLVVDGMQEIQEVLQAVLAPRGLRVDWVRSHVQQHASGTSDPDILVIDAEALPIQRTGGTRHWNNVPQVIIGAAGETSTADANDQHTYIPKPFLFPELIRAIEKLLPTRAAKVTNHSAVIT